MSFMRTQRGQADRDAETAAPPGEASPQPTDGGRGGSGGSRGNMLPPRQGRRFAVERVIVRLVATGGIIGIGVILGAILGSNNVQGWIMGLVIAVVTVMLAGLLWSSRQLRVGFAGLAC